ncbi:exonuclease [uncultured Caudovirales phage]|uniref:Exonuclease n=1 Tax=uncultured Caudovirales phage TaxID=2100421 RepID=A0A6J5NCZ0_9CAUD|nr:exonuclease [uncultured Caudovirales phage]
MITALIDADSLIYAVGFSSNDVEEPIAVSRLEQTMVELCMELDCEDYKGFLTGKGNFRDELAVTAPYKGQRMSEKPIHFQALRCHLVTSWGFTVVKGIEADDAVGIAAYALPEDETIMVHIDKDLNQFRGWHYNYRKQQKYYVSEFEGLVSFYTQILTGDRIDNIIGLKGIGPVKAKKILADCTNEAELFKAVLKAYDGDEKRVLENGQLLWLQRKENELWQLPQI